MGLIGKHNINNAQIQNRFNVSHKDLKGKIKDWPLELLVYTLNEIERQNGQVNKDDINTLQRIGVDSTIVFSLTKDGKDFWWDIARNNFTNFWKVYNKQK